MKKEQRELIRDFDRKYLNACQNSGLYTLGTALVFIAAVIFMMIPLQEITVMRRERALAAWMISTFFMAQPAAVYLHKYFTFAENGKNSRLLDKLRYLPVDIREIRRVRFDYLLKFQAKAFVPCLAVQLLFAALFAADGIRPENFLYAVCEAYIGPILWNTGYIFLQTRWKMDR
jgi:hypothetical protein